MPRGSCLLSISNLLIIYCHAGHCLQTLQNTTRGVTNVKLCCAIGQKHLYNASRCKKLIGRGHTLFCIVATRFARLDFRKTQDRLIISPYDDYQTSVSLHRPSFDA